MPCGPQRSADEIVVVHLGFFGRLLRCCALHNENVRQIREGDVRRSTETVRRLSVEVKGRSEGCRSV
jgi:hypothetical protein